MSTWVIIRSYPHADEGEFYYPAICGAYKSKRNAIEQILKLVIEDNLSVDNNDERDLRKKIMDYRKELSEGKILDVYSDIGNIFTLGECIIDKKYNFSRKVDEIHSKTR